MKRRVAFLVGLVFIAAAFDARATPDEEGEATSSWTSSTFQQHFGIEGARRLVHGEGLGATATEDALRGIDRAVSLGNEEGVALLVQLLGDARGLARADAMVLLSATRALAPFAAQHAVARVLAEAVLNPSGIRSPVRSGPGTTSQPWNPEADRRDRLELARETAAIALARAGDANATELLLSAARAGGPGQAAARRALVAFPPIVVVAPVASTSSGVNLSVALGDLRADEFILESSRSLEPSVRALALRGLGALGDARCLRLAEDETHDPDATVRVAAAHVLVDLGAPDAVSAVRRLVEDDVTAMQGIELSARVDGDEVVGALASRAHVSSDIALRMAAVAALGRQQGHQAIKTLREFMHDPVLAGDAAFAIARSADPTVWGAIVEILGEPASRRMGARMAAVRGHVFGQVPETVTRAVKSLSRSADGADRAAGVAALILLGEVGPESGLIDVDPRVRRAAAMSSEPTNAAHARALADRLGNESDPATRLVLSRGLASEEAATSLTTNVLREHVREGSLDAPIFALLLAQRGEEPERGAIEEALASVDPILRAHTARGLESSRQPWAVRCLADAYELEVDPGVRRAIVLALAGRLGDVEVPAWARAVGHAAYLDPEPAIRTIAEHALRGLPPPRLSWQPDTVWFRVMDDTGRPPSTMASGVVLRADGLAVPITFDDDGYAVTPAPHGAAHLLLAPRLRAYDSGHHVD